jgi:hypothetical protein
LATAVSTAEALFSKIEQGGAGKVLQIILSKEEGITWELDGLIDKALE